MKKKKLLIIGLDGATFKILNPLAKKGYLPTIKKLMEGGVKGKLQSTIPPITGPAWVSFATGKNPGKTGVYDFFNRKNKKTYKIYPVSSKNFKHHSYWDILSKRGHRVGIINFPTLYPAYKINGYMVSGIWGKENDKLSFWPRSLSEKIKDYQISYAYSNERNPSTLIKDLKKLVWQKVTLAKKVAKKITSAYFGFLRN